MLYGEGIKLSVDRKDFRDNYIVYGITDHEAVADVVDVFRSEGKVNVLKDFFHAHFLYPALDEIFDCLDIVVGCRSSVVACCLKSLDDFCVVFCNLNDRAEFCNINGNLDAFLKHWCFKEFDQIIDFCIDAIPHESHLAEISLKTLCLTFVATINW